MKVSLKGMSIPTDVLEEILEYVPEPKREEYRNKLTPESISAAYARISRKDLSVDELLDESIKDIATSKKSNEFIIFGLGHHSVAQHIMFNFNVMNVSRLAVESIERRRIAAYTEKSQRYITLDGDYVMPKEFIGDDKDKFKLVIELQNQLYFKVKDKILQKVKKEFPNKKPDDLEGMAKEDARYSASLATKAQLGCSYDAETLELAIRELKYGNLAEEREFSKTLYDLTVKVAPSLIQLTDSELFRQHNKGKELEDDNFKHTRKNLKNLVDKYFKKYNKEVKDLIDELGRYSYLPQYNTTLLNKENIDKKVLTSLLHTNSKRNIEECEFLASNLLLEHKDDAKEFVKEALKYISTFDKLPREFEAGYLDYEIVLSSSAFAQLKRHRLNTLVAQDYDPALGHIIPRSIEEVGMAKGLKEVCDRSSDLYYKFLPKYGKAAEYCLTNAHKRKVLLTTNLRQLYHISRMREDSHAQWEIRYIANEMSKLAKEAAPITTILLGGKDKFEDIRKNVYGE